MIDDFQRILAQKISTACWKNIMEFNYQNSDKNRSRIERKTVEVYDLKWDKKQNHYFFFGYDLAEGQLKRYNLPKVVGDVMIGKEFVPRYEKKDE